jgi:hypothetical protein
MHFTRLRRAFWQAFQHGQFSSPKERRTRRFLRCFPRSWSSRLCWRPRTTQKVSGADWRRRGLGACRRDRVSGAGILSEQAASCHAHHLLGFYRYAAGGHGSMISWMDGFRKAYGMANTWGFWRETASPSTGLAGAGAAGICHHPGGVRN